MGEIDYSNVEPLHWSAVQTGDVRLYVTDLVFNIVSKDDQWFYFIVNDTEERINDFVNAFSQHRVVDTYRNNMYRVVGWSGTHCTVDRLSDGVFKVTVFLGVL